MVPVSVYDSRVIEYQLSRSFPLNKLENLTVTERRNIAIPKDQSSSFGYSRCSSYVADWKDVLNTGQRPNETWSTQECQYGWEFDKTEIPYQTISSELGWVCEKNSYQAIAQSIYFIGSVFGSLLFGWISDSFGRLPATTVSNMFGCVSGITSIFSTNIIDFSVSRFVMGMAYDRCMMMPYLLVLEFVGPKYRSVITNVPFAIFFMLGSVALPWIALACHDWRVFSLATSIPLVLTLLTPLLIPESPRWLLSMNRVDEAIDKVNNIAKINGETIPENMIQLFKTNVGAGTKEDESSCLEIFKRPLMLKMFLSMCLLYSCNVISYDVLLRNIESLGYDFFLSFTLISITELPACILVGFVLDRLGRKFMMVVSLGICIICCITIILLSGGLAAVAFAMIARFTLNISYNISMQWPNEIVPTCVRGSATSIIHICGVFAAVLSPYIAYSENYVTGMPLILIAIISATGILCCFVIPETSGKDLPQTFSEAEELVVNEKCLIVPISFPKFLLKWN
ncbi:unnamed protein product [Leptidea sinapis]|uniref:Major facilitator superfamily (MFS) profile domain-containing protein n=1 Tax=Leptidea sinapis TaxID=189913 RepID=A0A5E4QRU7_9NEOP|nr:unnamed protein product [Leptidea sinapis]